MPAPACCNSSPPADLTSEIAVPLIKQFAVLMIVSALIVEVLQFITFRGSTDIDDVILNTIGAVIVYLLMKTKFVKKLLKKVIDISE